MNKPNVLIFFGGCSSEYAVSLESASAVIDGVDRTKYDVVTVGIAQNGDWFYYSGDTHAIREDRWLKSGRCIPAALSPCRSSHELLVFHEGGIKRIHIDAAFPVLHGKNGEDGTLQGLIELAGIPLVGCGTLASALCMDKNRAHKLAQLAGVRAPKAMLVARETPLRDAQTFAEAIGYPLFVKPVRAGSSYGVSRVARASELKAALAFAFEQDNEAMIEEAIAGFEVGCAVLGTSNPTTGEVDEIELSGDFFDYTEKYTLKTASIHVPARIPSEKAAAIKRAALCIYRALGCTSFARVDMFLTPDGEIVFNEVNTIPGFTAHSRYPGMMRAAGWTFETLVDRLIQEAISCAD